MAMLSADAKARIKKQASLIAPKIVSIRRELHRHPERSKREKETSDRVASYLAGLGYQVTRGTEVYSVTTTLSGQKKGKTVALRADIDALKLEEQSGLPFASEVEGVMHACGHDAHTAILIGVAEILSGMRDSIPGNVKFLFQPSEEAFPGGAPSMIKEGALKNPEVDAAFALHTDSTLPTGSIAVRPGPNIGGVTAIEIRVKGPGGHFAYPTETVDTIVVAAHVLVSLQSLVTRQVDHWEPFVLTFGQIIGGTRDNVIPDEVIIRGDMGAVNTRMREDLERNIERLVKGVTESFGASYQLKFWRGYPTLENDPAMVELVEEVAAGVIGRDRVLPSKPSLVGEDFAFFAQKVPSALFWLGAWDQSKYKVPTHHHDPRFDMDEACIPLGMELTANLALEYLLRNA